MRQVGLVGMLTVFLFAGCSDPCEKALAKMQKCWKLTQKKEENKADAAIFSEVCKHEKGKFKKCLKITDCTEYAKCISDAATDPRAVEILKKQAAGVEADMPAAPAEADMPAAPADMQ